jgi:hypothetical protein
MSGDVGENRDRLVAFIEKQGIALTYTEKIAPALGMSYGGRIAILPGQSKAEEFSTLVHELAHEMLDKAERRTVTTKVVRETEAEAIAFVITKAVGLETGSASADYIHLYHGNASLLAESLEVIQQTSAFILAALEPTVPDEMPDAHSHPGATARLEALDLGQFQSVNLHIKLHSLRVIRYKSFIMMVKSADTADLKSADPYQVVGVQVPLRAPYMRSYRARSLAHGLCTDRPDAGDVLQQVVRDGVSLLEVGWAVVGEPDFAVGVLPDECFQGQVDGNGRRGDH